MNESVQSAAPSPGSRWQRLGIVILFVVVTVALLFIIPSGEYRVKKVDLGVIYKNKASGNDIDYHGNKISLHYVLSQNRRYVPVDLSNLSHNASDFAAMQQPALADVGVGDKCFYSQLGSVSAHGQTHLDFYFTRYNLVVSVSKPVVLENWKVPELDKIEIEAVARTLDDAVRRRGPGTRVNMVTVGERVQEAVRQEQIPGLVAVYFLMGGYVLGIEAIPAIILLILARFIPNPLARLATRCFILALALAPGVAAGEGGIYVGPGIFMILEDPRVMVPSLMITFGTIFFIAAASRYIWKGRV